ncbi:glycine cleavage system protein R [Thermocrinis sp.]
MNFFLISLFGKDRPGIVAEVSKVLYDLGLNIEDSSMTRLKGEFTVMLVVSCPEDIGEEKIMSMLKGVGERFDLYVACKKLPKDWEKEYEGKEIYRIVVSGADKPGIVYSVSKVLSEKGINISDLRTERRGELYLMLIEAESQEDRFDELKQDLDQLKSILGVDIHVERDEEAVL